MSVSDLPQELLTLIFSYYVRREGLRRLLDRVMPVCDAWKDAAMNPSLWKVIDDPLLRRHHLLSLCTMGVLSHTVKLNLSYQAKHLKESDLKCILSWCFKLKELDLGHNKVNTDVLIHVMDACPDIESLNLDSVTASTKRLDLHIMTPVLKTFGDRLKYLNLSNNTFTQVSVLLSRIADNCHCLEELHIVNVTGTSVSFPIGKMQTGCPKLKVLEVGAFEYSSVGAKESNGFPDLEVFKSAVFCCRYLYNRDLLLMLKSSTKLRVLDIRGCCPVCECLCRIPCENLERLYLSHSQAAKQGNLFVLIAKWRHSLKELDISRIPNENILKSALTTLVSGNIEPPLESLDLSCSVIEPKLLKTVVTKCPNLTYLNVESCRDLPRGTKRIYRSRKEINKVLARWDE